MKIKKISSIITPIILALLMVTSTAFVVSNVNTTTVNASTTIPSSLLQYEWPTLRSSNTGSFFAEGPAPDSPSIQWKAGIPCSDYVTGPLVAFNGMIFAQTESSTVAMDAATGELVWTAEGVGGDLYGYGFGSGICKINDEYMLVGGTCLHIADGTTAWVGPAGFSAPSLVFSGAGYVPELEMLFDGTNGWDMSDPSQPPTLVWTLAGTMDGSGSPVYGDGKLFLGCSDLFMRAYDARTGVMLWETPVTSTSFTYGMSYGDGKVFHGGVDGNMRAWDAETGELLWTYTPETYFNWWASSTAYAYGMVYSMNQDTHLYAVNATTGELVWRAKGPGVGYPWNCGDCRWQNLR